MDVTNVQVIVGHDTNVFMFVGMDVTNNGMNNPVCAMVSAGGSVTSVACWQE